MLKSLKNAAPFAVAGFVVLLVAAGVWFIETPTHNAAEFQRPAFPAIGSSYAVKIAYLGVPDRADLDIVVPPYPYMEAERIERMVQRGDATWLQPGDRITLLEIAPESDTERETIHHARVETPHGELWVLLANVTFDEKSEPIADDTQAARHAAATSEP